MKTRSSLLILLFVLALNCHFVPGQQLTIKNGTGQQVLLSRADLESLPHVKVTAAEHSSGVANFEGVTLKSVLERAGVTIGESMKGKPLTHCLLVEAADGYRAVIALPELDPGFTDK